MEITINQPVEVDARYIELKAAVRYGDEDMPEDFPGRNGELWEVLIDIDSGALELDDEPFPKVSLDLHMKVCDCCSVALLNEDYEPIVSHDNEYVPGFFPGDHYGDYLIFNIVDGKIENWSPREDSVQGWVDSFEED